MHGLRPTVYKNCIFESLRKVMESCWDANPEKRPTMDEVIDMLYKISKSDVAELGAEQPQGAMQRAVAKKSMKHRQGQGQEEGDTQQEDQDAGSAKLSQE